MAITSEALRRAEHDPHGRYLNRGSRGAGVVRDADRADRLRLAAGVLAGSVSVLCILGVVMVLAASSIYADVRLGSPWSVFERQCLWMVLGGLAALVARLLPVPFWRRVSPWLLGGTFLLLLVVFLPGLGHDVAGSSRWVGTSSLRIQPSEVMKLAITIFAADLLARREDARDEWRDRCRPLLAVYAVAAILIVEQPDLGTAIVLSCVTFGLLFAAGVRLRLVGPLLAVVAVAGTVVALDASYRRARLLSFLDPFAHATGSGYQVVQSLVTISSGHLGGAGVGASYVAWGFLPNNQTDFIFAMIGNELGLFGALAVLGLFAAIAWAGIEIARHSTDRFSSLLATGIIVWLLAEAIINIGGVIGVMPVTGIPLPFISFGGSALVVAMVGVGILLRIAHDGSAGPRRRRA
jgi:cell division protein FtsW